MAVVQCNECLRFEVGDNRRRLHFHLGLGVTFCFCLVGSMGANWLVAAVNRSIWEHLKLGYWPALFYAALEFGF